MAGTYARLVAVSLVIWASIGLVLLLFSANYKTKAAGDDLTVKLMEAEARSSRRFDQLLLEIRLRDEAHKNIGESEESL